MHVKHLPDDLETTCRVLVEMVRQQGTVDYNNLMEDMNEQGFRREISTKALWRAHEVGTIQVDEHGVVKYNGWKANSTTGTPSKGVFEVENP
jgi:hypothetical protein